VCSRGINVHYYSALLLKDSSLFLIRFYRNLNITIILVIINVDIIAKINGLIIFYFFDYNYD